MAKNRCDSDASCQSCGTAETCSAEEKERHAQQRIDATILIILWNTNGYF